MSILSRDVADSSRQILYATFGRFITRDCAFRKAIALPETDNAKIGPARTYVRQNYLKTTPNCRLNWKYVAAGLCPLGNQYIIHGVSITNLRLRIMQGRPRRERCYKINGKLIALSKNVYQDREKCVSISLRPLSLAARENFTSLNSHHPRTFPADITIIRVL